MKLFFLKDKMPLIENAQPVTPKAQLDEIDAITDSLDTNIEKDVTIPPDVMNSFTIKDKLNPEIWIGNKLEPRIRLKLIKIAKDFLKDLELPKTIIIRDIIFTGSLVNFNWSKYSDIDLHVVLDFNQFDIDPKMASKFFTAQKNIWNEEHDITVFDYPVELYVQDKNEKHTATAIFSILKNKWLLKPKHESFQIDKSAIKTKANKFIYLLKDIRQDYKDKAYQTVVDKVTKLKAKIKQMRMAGLERGGEFSLENLVFKVLRRTPFLEQLTSFKNKAYDSLMSVAETLNEDKINEIGYLDTKISNFLANKLKVKLGFKELKPIGSGNNGYAYSVGNGKVMKITTDLSEYSECLKIKGKKNKHIADIYAVYRLTGEYNNIVIIILEHLETDDELFEEMDNKLNSEFNSIFEDTLGYFVEFTYDYQRGNIDWNVWKKVEETLFPRLDEETNKFAIQYFGMIDELKKLGITSSDFSPRNLGFKKDGSLAYLDLGFGEDSDEFHHQLTIDEEALRNKGGVLLIKGEKLQDGTSRLYITTTKKIMYLDRTKANDSMGQPASMCVIANDVYRITKENGILKAHGVAWKSEASKFQRLGLTKNNVVLNDNKTPLWRDSLKFSNVAQAINSLKSIPSLPNIKWEN